MSFILILLFIGTIIGATTGLTGAGGALVAIPLFMNLLEMSLKEASLFSLVAVLVSASINIMATYQHIQLRTTLPMVIIAIIASYLATPLKILISDWLIVLLIILVCLYALMTMWTPHILQFHKKNKARTSDLSHIAIMVRAMLLGPTLGLLTTLTGLGGGVLLVPIFINAYYFSMQKAVATSLMAIALTALFSLFFQVQKGLAIPDGTTILYLCLGMSYAVVILKFLQKRVSEQRWLKIRKVVFTLLVFLANWYTLMSLAGK